MNTDQTDQTDTSLFIIQSILQQEIYYRIGYTWAFITILLDLYTTKNDWNQLSQVLELYLYRINTKYIQLPYINLKSRTSAKKEKQKWYKLYIESYRSQYSKQFLYIIKKEVFLHFLKANIQYTIIQL
jgi:hypothetical protein